MDSSVVNLINQHRTGGAPPKPSSQLGKEEFLKLLMTQLQAQDPMNPSDSTQFVAQLAGFASLEQETNVNKKMDDLIKVTSGNSSGNAVQLLGKEIKVQGSTIGGPTTMFYNLQDHPATAFAEIRDKNHAVVQTLQLPTNIGEHSFEIKGIQPGQPYSVRLVTKDQTGKEASIPTAFSDQVKGVHFDEGVPVLEMASGVLVKATDVVEIREQTQRQKTQDDLEDQP